MAAYCLTVHASYRCQHAGKCCTAAWPIPIDSERVFELRTRGLLTDAHTRALCDADGMAISLRKTSKGACVFYGMEHDGLCGIQRDAGARLMPSACRNFPRVALRDPRGIFVTLSHFCPTAAGLLLTADAIAIVLAPASISLDGEVEGLDATGVMPPLLRSNMLMDWDGYGVWERESLAVLNDRRYSARAALDIISIATRHARTWSPGGQTLSAHILEAFNRTRSESVSVEMLAHGPLEQPRKAFLASHVFASWAAYQGDLSAVVEQLELALSLLGSDLTDQPSFIAAVRAADWRLRHNGEHVRPRSLSSLRRH
jgi:Fe-S-cluster containining protein